MRYLPGLATALFLATGLCAPASAEPDRAEITFWESVRDSKTPAELDAYLKAFPNGAFAPLARIRSRALRHGEEKPGEVPAPGGLRDDIAGRAGSAEGPAERLTLTAALAKKEIDGEQRTVLGVNISDFSGPLRSCFGMTEATGALVQGVLSESAAANAGIVSGDVIWEFEGKPVDTARRLMDLVSAQPAGATVKIGVLRPQALLNGAQELKDRAATGEAELMLCVALGHVLGMGVEKNPIEANHWFRKAAGAGNSMAMFNLASNLMDGNGVPKDRAEANRWYRKAAEAGNTGAMVSLAAHLQSGDGISKDIAEANRWYRKAAESGNAVAMHNLANNLSRGDGITKDDAAATRWYQKAVELGQTESMVGLGWQYEYGRSVVKDEAEAARLYRQAAERGSGLAMSLLAGLLREGRGVAKDESEALRWYRKAAEKGVGAAMSALSEGYDQGGLGLEKDPKLAAEWLYKGIEAGDEYAPVRLIQSPNLYSRQLRRELQRLLQEAGHYTGDVDGGVGAETKSAINALQASAIAKRRTASEEMAPPSSSASASPPLDFGNVKDLDELD